MSRSVGIAFQGGGAKVIGLIAAADAISKLVADGVLRIEAISGTSAGSLAALLLSANVDFSKVKTAIRKQDAFIKTRFPKIGKFTAFGKAAKFIAFGSPVYGIREFNQVIEAILLEAGIDINSQLQDVAKMPLTVVVSDIYMGKSITLSDGGLRDVLRRSCAIPFVFSSHKSEDQGQFLDGGIFDNLPTEVLANKLGLDVPVFAVGFQHERAPTPENAFGYIISLVGSVVTHNVARSCEGIGLDYVCPVSTSLGTLDFDKIVAVGLDQEYDAIKAATTQFFNKWLQGLGGTRPQRAGQRTFTKLRDVEQKLVEHVEAAFRAVPGTHEHVKMSVVANSLEHAHVADDITIEQLLLLPAGYSLHGTIIPLIDGAGTPDRIECIVKADGPNGADIPFTQFLIDDEFEVRGVRIRRNSLAILFSDNLVANEIRRLYIAKKETRFGFMAPMRSGNDRLAISASYWAAKTLEIQLSVPATYSNISCDWACRGSSLSSQELPKIRDTPRAGWLTVGAELRNVARGGQLKGLFTGSSSR
ncbi:MAG: patatin-like phospholipase family protein [Labrys sp. (in: a-proteobacteria)]